jgi:hypothetical protein
VFLNIALDEEIKRTISGASESMLQTKNKRSMGMSFGDEGKKLMLEKLEEEILFPPVVKEIGFKSYDNLEGSISRELKKLQSPTKLKKQKLLK